MATFQNFTTFAVTDNAPPNDRFTVTQHQIAVDDMNSNENIYVVKDFGVGHFTVIDHLMQIEMPVEQSLTGLTFFWALDGVGTGLTNEWNNNRPAYTAYMSDQAGATNQLFLWEFNAAHNGDADNWSNFVVATPYYPRIHRDLGVGVFGTNYLKLYDDAIRTNLVVQLSNTLTVAVQDQRFLYGASSWNSGHAARIQDFDVKNLDIQEAVGVQLGNWRHQNWQEQFMAGMWR